MKKRMGMYVIAAALMMQPMLCMADETGSGGLSVGDYVILGSYEQDNDIENGQEDIEWQVLDIQEGKALLISRYALDNQKYNTDYEEMTWESCTLRAWLNDTFLNEAFDSTEQMAILSTEIDNSSRQNPNGRPGGNNTEDKVFLLSYQEAIKYFWDTEPLCAPTAYAQAQGAYTYYAVIQNGEDDRGTEVKKAAGCWWLRSPGDSSSCAEKMYYDRRIDCENIDVSNPIRPAIWVDTESAGLSRVGAADMGDSENVEYELGVLAYLDGGEIKGYSTAYLGDLPEGESFIPALKVSNDYDYDLEIEVTCITGNETYSWESTSIQAGDSHRFTLSSLELEPGTYTFNWYINGYPTEIAEFEVISGPSTFGSDSQTEGSDSQTETDTPSNTSNTAADDSQCSYCDGSGYCSYCDGLGENECSCLAGMCSSCSGMGYRQVYTKDGYEYPSCTTCGGTGNHARCNGTGWLTCTYCDGTGFCAYCDGTGER